MADPTVSELLLCATNEGAFYPRFLRIARNQQRAALDARGVVTPLGASVAAFAWLDAGRDYVERVYTRTAPGFLMTPAELLAFAAELEAYYAEHLGEFDAEQLARLDAKNGA